jgi:Type I phosphodiesterase / nucleotide pyrophosphatase
MLDRAPRSTRAVRLALILVAVIALACEPGDGGAPPRSAERPSRANQDCDSRPLVMRMSRGYVPGRSPDVLLVPREPNYIGAATRPVHTGPWDYLVQVPLVFYGPGVVEGRAPVQRAATVADIAPTLAEIIGLRDRRWDGRSLPEVAAADRRPRVIVVVVLDGVGRNVLEVHDGAAPFLTEIRSRGIDYPRATVGSSPSNTPPIHTTIGTGVFPRRHGIPHVQMRAADGSFVDPFEGNEGASIRVPTLADLYDVAVDNRAEIGLAATVNWHLGMIGHGSAFPEGDADKVVLLNDGGEQYGAGSLYNLVPVAEVAALGRLIDRVDARDGTRDGAWRGEDLADPAVRQMSPAFVQYEQLMLERLLRRGSFGRDEITDLVFVNMKAADAAGHRWGMTSNRVRALVRAEDSALHATARFLDDSVGHGDWLLVVTADHGQTPYPEESGAWPIRGQELNGDLRDEFGAAAIQRTTTAGVFLSDRSRAERVARWLGDYSVEDNIVRGESTPSGWRGREEETLFDIIMAGRKVMVNNCVPDDHP